LYDRSPQIPVPEHVMPDTLEVQSVVSAAEQAAAAGDLAAAERLLRTAVGLQETEPGDINPDLANTLNNLGIVCEMTEQPAEAERCYRRAYAIATAALEPDHPYVITSRKNLTDFCEARGRTLEAPVPPPPAAPKQPVASSAPERRWPMLEESLWRALLPRSTQPFTIVAWGLCMLVLLLVIVTRPWDRSAAPRAQTVSESPSQAPIAPEPVGPPEAATPRVVASAPPAARERPRVGNSATGVRAPAPPRPLTARVQPLVETAALCKGLSTRTTPDWRCDPAGRVVDSGAIYFYTRIRAPGATTVEHRWYKDNLLFQNVELDVQPNARNGYRTYSRHTVKDGSQGSWRVELRTNNGQVLHEERFTIANR
jgi:hypothetical protein